jgi:threonyl-tRNA synthetase
LDQAKKEFMTRFNLCIQILEEIGLSKNDYEVAVRFTKDFYAENKQFIGSLAEAFGKPVLVEMWEERFFYFVLKWDFNFVDNQDKAAALSTDQIDVENAKRYGITYTDEKGEKRYPLILHCSPSGAIERDVYALLEKAYRTQQEGGAPMLPEWLSPTQVRMIPISDSLLKDVERFAEELEKHSVRVDIDDRPLTLQKKVREAETEWVPYTVVVGKKELESGTLPVRERSSRKMRRLQLNELLHIIEKNTAGKPFKPLPVPKYLSKRPQFHG